MTAGTTRRALQALALIGVLFVSGVLILFWGTREEGPWILGIGPLRPPPTLTGEWQMAEWWGDRIGLILCIGAAAFIAVFLAVRKIGSHRQPMGHCRTCGYDLRGLSRPRCPECGHCVAPGALAPRKWERDETFWNDKPSARAEN